MLFVVRRILGVAGWSVDTAIDSASALQQIRPGRYSALIIDLRLPDLSGIELIRQVRSKNIWTPAILFTGFPSVESAVEATKLGLEYVVKTEASASRLVDIVASAIRESRESEAAAHRRLRHRVRTMLEELEPAPWLDEERRTRYGSTLGLSLVDSALPLSAWVMASRLFRAVCDRRTIATAVVQLARLQMSLLPRAQPHGAARPDTDLSCIGDHDPAWAHSMRRAVVELGTSNEQVAQIAYGLGYDHHSALDRDFHAFFGTSPSGFRRTLRSSSP